MGLASVFQRNVVLSATLAATMMLSAANAGAAEKPANDAAANGSPNAAAASVNPARKSYQANIDISNIKPGPAQSMALFISREHKVVAMAVQVGEDYKKGPGYACEKLAEKFATSQNLPVYCVGEVMGKGDGIGAIYFVGGKRYLARHLDDTRGEFGGPEILNMMPSVGRMFVEKFPEFKDANTVSRLELNKD